MNSQKEWPGGRVPIVLVGPTATGKTEAAIELAERRNGEIINADSMQVYRGMDIGTAKPNMAQQERIPFHLIDIVTPDLPFTVADWKARAERALEEIAVRGRQPIICGGTGLYIRALLDDWALAATPASPELRAQLQLEAQQSGSEGLHQRLVSIDPQTAARLHTNDTVRIIRALEVYQVTGETLSSLQRRDRQSRQTRTAIRLGLTMARPSLYERIERRIDAMLAGGLETEVRTLLASGYAPTLSPMKGLGYKEMVHYLQGELDYATTVSEIKQNTRRYAKRQQTWFRADALIRWIDVTALSSATVANDLENAIQEQGDST